MSLNSPRRSWWCRLDQPSFRWRSIWQASWRSSPVCSSRRCRSSWRGQSRPHTRSCSHSTWGRFIHSSIQKNCFFLLKRLLAGVEKDRRWGRLTCSCELRGLGGWSSCCWGTPSLGRCRSWTSPASVTGGTERDTGVGASLCPCPAGGSRAPVFEACGQLSSNPAPALHTHLLCFHTSGRICSLQKPCSVLAYFMGKLARILIQKNIPSNNK